MGVNAPFTVRVDIDAIESTEECHVLKDTYLRTLVCRCPIVDDEEYSLGSGGSHAIASVDSSSRSLQPGLVTLSGDIDVRSPFSALGLLRECRGTEICRPSTGNTIIDVILLQ